MEMEFENCKVGFGKKKNWELGLTDFALAGKMGFKLHWDWDLVTGNRKKMLKMKNGNGI